MNTRYFLLPMALLAAAASAAPADDMSRVEVTGQKAQIERYDVRQACTKIDASLSHRLGNAWFKDQPVGEMVVRFQLDGDQVDHVKTSGFSMMYLETRKAVRNAVRELECKGDTAGKQNYAFMIVFKAPGEEGGADRFAVSEMPASSRGE